MPRSRQLAAIMFTDIVGYTTLMSKSEDKGLKLLESNRKVQTDLAQQHGGKLLKEIGDGTLLFFNSAVDAVQCALKIQQSANEISDLLLRIGIHVGDVVFEKEDIFGDGVNVASRIEPFADAGGICITEQVFQMIRNKSEWAVDFIGERQLKNVEYPVKIYTVQQKNAAQSYKQNSSIEIVPLKNKSIAVLPFTNMSADQEQEYFCDGLTEDILNNLTCVDDLQIVSRTAIFALKGQKQNIQQIGQTLGVQNIVDGSVRKSANRLRISVQLIKVSDGFMLWSERYDRELKDIFEIQDEIALKICQALEAKLTSKEQKAIEKIKTHNVKAYDFYIKGRYYFLTRSKSQINRAIEMFQKAIQKDPNYALAYTGLADSYSYYYHTFQRTKSYLDQALFASQRALELDPDLPEAHLSRGLALDNTRDSSGAAKEYEQAIRLNPQFFQGFYQYARSCFEQGKHSKAMGLFKKASEIHPDDYEAAGFQIFCLESMGIQIDKVHYHKVIKLVRNHLDLNPEDTRALYLGAGILAKSEEKDQAITWVEKAIAQDPNDPMTLYNASCVFTKLGDIDRALDTFEKMAKLGGFTNSAWIDNDPDVNLIREHPRFLAALKKFSK